MDTNKATARQARRFLFILCFALVVFTLGSVFFDIGSLRGEYENLAAEVGRSFYQAIDTMRAWNLDHGGIFVQEGADISPNPYLLDPLREIATAEGLKLSMINHSQMTRLLSELLTHQRGIHLHITSLTPLNPGNAPNSWERQALNRLERGNKEEYDVVQKEGESVFNYIAPLAVKDTCLTCHQGQITSTQRVYGGISVSFSYTPFMKVMASERKQIYIMHAVFLALGLALIGLTGHKLLRSITALQESLLRVKRLEGLLPICANCKKIRLAGAKDVDDKSWVAVEKYITDRTDAEFTHGLCPQCFKTLYPDLRPPVD
jgi:hypothetical protein